MARVYNENLFKALEGEFDTDARIAQLQALKDIIDEAGPGLLSPDEVNGLGGKVIEYVGKSLERIQENKEFEKKDVEDEDDALDEEDLHLLASENLDEYNLQTGCAEIIGTLFKHYKESVANLVNECKTKLIPESFASNVAKRYRFAIFILDDMIEHLGPSYFSPEDWFTIVSTICQYCDHRSAAIRQAAAYGIGVVAQNSGDAFATHGELCLGSLKKTIEMPITEKVQARKEKITEYNHARDNAIASLGKTIRY